MIKISLRSVIFALAVVEVTCWTIGLPEARKFLFEKNDRLKKESYEEERYKSENAKQVFFSNRENSNSKHHEDPHRRHRIEHGAYAKEYGYQSYMEKKVRDIVHDGSEYLEGLQRSIQRYSVFLENCTRADRNGSSYSLNTTSYNETTFNATLFDATPAPWLPQNELPPYNGTYNITERCRRATRASERVRRLAELATKATKELQDIAYTRRYMKDDPHELSKEENELILKLAWFLDRLAYYTGYSPRYRKEDYRQSSSSPPAPAASLGMMNASAPVMRAMMNCLKMKSDVPATVRCAYPAELPGMVAFLINNSNPVPPMPAAASNRNERLATFNDELLIATDNRPPYAVYSRQLAPVTNYRKRALNTSSRKKRSLESPAITFFKYFVKHKVFENDNPKKSNYVNDVFEEFEVNNHLRQKRDSKLKLPEDPFQDLSKYVKNKKAVHHVPDEAQAQKLRDAIFKITNTKTSTPKEHSRKISKLLYLSIKKDRFKRSYTYQENLAKPRDPDDLFKDISYYVKNKNGTNRNSNVVQAGQLRAGLAQIFLNPNIETVRRYGSNYNPLIADPLMFAAMRGAADN